MVPLKSVTPGDAHILHQSIIGAWPLDLEVFDADGVDAFVERLTVWQLKALREAKLRTSWMSPDPAYEDACRDYLERLFSSKEARASLGSFVQRIAPAGVAKSEAQTVLRLTAPGVPDLYQGTERWDFSLVDPDNRRPVLFAPEAPSHDWRSGWRKYTMIKELLELRKERSEMFKSGVYRPLILKGERANEALAFQRSRGDETLTVLVALRGAQACIARNSPELGHEWWGDTSLHFSD
ncbi:hypothetical protein LTR94_029975, partial [Friedmanniomyces endolithicus]